MRPINGMFDSPRNARHRVGDTVIDQPTHHKALARHELDLRLDTPRGEGRHRKALNRYRVRESSALTSGLTSILIDPRSVIFGRKSKRIPNSRNWIVIDPEVRSALYDRNRKFTTHKEVSFFTIGCDHVRLGQNLD